MEHVNKMQNSVLAFAEVINISIRKA
jgi:hypothetical protein